MLSLVVGFVSAAAAQRVITLNPVNLQGDFVQAGPRAVVVKAGDGRNWTLAIGKETHVKVKGTAAPEVLVPRTCVRFIASIDKRTGKAKDKIDKVTIFTQTPGVANRTLGVEFAKDAQQDDDGEAGPGAAKPPGPPGAPPPGPGPGPMPGQGPPPGRGPQNGAGPDADAPPVDEAPPINSKPKRSGRGGKTPALNVPDVASYEVCAQIVSYHGHRMTVTAPNRFFKAKITAELSPDAEIRLDLSDLSLAKPGDKVSGQGYYLTPGMCPHTDSVTITLANTLGARGGHSRRPSTAAKGGEAAHRPTGKSKSGPAAASPDQAPPGTDDKSADAAPADKTSKPDESTKKKPPEKDDVNDLFGK
jgi:hypothetical protein